MTQKELPPPSAPLVFHPECDSQYRHFENANRHPFEPGASDFSRANAWWLADAALLAYWDQEKMRQVYSALRLESRFVQNESTQCHVAWNDCVVIVAFRGTQPNEWQDILDDAHFSQDDWPTGRVHRGFKEALNRVWEQLYTLLTELNNGQRTFWFSGHSLGAALATLAADRFDSKPGPRTSGVYTFGSPRVGDSRFAGAFTAAFARRAFRYVNHADVVTHVPPPLFPIPPVEYRHVDPREYIDVAGTISEARPSIPHFVVELIGAPKHLLEMVHALQRGEITILPEFLVDHTPRRYAVRVWNDLDAH